MIEYYICYTIDTDFDTFGVEGFRFLAGFAEFVWGLTCLPVVDKLFDGASFRLKSRIDYNL